MSNVVVGVDGSEDSRKAMDVAVVEATRRSATLTFVHSIAFPVAFGYPNMPVDPLIMLAAGERLMETELNACVERHGGELPVPHEEFVRQGHTGSLLVEAARDAELLVMGSRGLGPVRSLLIGSSTTYCLHHLPCPLLVVPGDV